MQQRNKVRVVIGLWKNEKQKNQVGVPEKREGSRKMSFLLWTFAQFLIFHSLIIYELYRPTNAKRFTWTSLKENNRTWRHLTRPLSPTVIQNQMQIKRFSVAPFCSRSADSDCQRPCLSRARIKALCKTVIGQRRNKTIDKRMLPIPNIWWWIFFGF